MNIWTNNTIYHSFPEVVMLGLIAKVNQNLGRQADKAGEDIPVERTSLATVVEA